eukprot:1820656-Rhodomonas_salina.2
MYANGPAKETQERLKSLQYLPGYAYQVDLQFRHWHVPDPSRARFLLPLVLASTSSTSSRSCTRNSYAGSKD